MIADGEKVGANAIVNVRFMTSVISQGAAEVLAYGTAVKSIKMNYVTIFWGICLILLIAALVNRFSKKDNLTKEIINNILKVCFINFYYIAKTK